MPVSNPSADVSVDIDGHIATVEIHRPPHNYFDVALIRAIASAYHALDDAIWKTAEGWQIQDVCRFSI